jgi:hypothetical protein
MVLLLIVLGALLACGEPSPRLRVKVRLPPGMSPDPARLHLTEDDDGDPAFVAHLSRAEPASLEPLTRGFQVELDTGIGPARYVYLHVWYDNNGDGRVDAGDAVGDLAPAPFVAWDNGGCSSRTNHAPDLVLRRLS